MKSAASVFFPSVLSLIVLSCLALCSPAFSAEPIVAHIDSLWTNDQRDAALSLLEIELPRARAAGDSLILSKLLVAKGAYNNFLGNGLVAESVLRDGVALARARRDSTLLLSGLRWLGLAVGSQGRRSEALILYQELLDLGELLGDRRHQGWANIGLAWANWRNGEGEIALAQYERAAVCFAGTGDVQGELWANNGIAAVNSDLGRYDEAGAGYLAAIDVARSRDRPMAEAMALNNLGTLEYSLGRADVALGYFQQARTVQALLRNMRQQISPMYNITLCQNDLGQHAAARQTLEEALALCEEYGYRDLRSKTLIKIANMEIQRQRLNKAAALIEEAMNDPETMMVKDVIEARIELGEAYRRQGDFEAAAREFSQAELVLEDKPLRWVRLRLMGYQATVFRDLGGYQRALDQFLVLVETATNQGMPQYRLKALADAAQTSLLLARPDSARTMYERAAAAWEKDRRQLLSPQWRERRGASGREIFTDLALLIHEAGDPAGAFDRVQSYKSRTLLERMLGPGEALAKSLARDDYSTARLGDLQSKVLAPDELFLDFVLGPRVSLLFAVTQDSLVMRRLPGSAQIADRVRAYYDLLKDPRTGSSVAVTAVGAELRAFLLGDLLSGFSTARRIIVAPDGVLNLLPFAEMHVSADWVRVPSSSVLLELRQRHGNFPTGTWRTLAVASDWCEQEESLTGTLLEVQQLARDYQQVEMRVLSGMEAELPALAGYDILHLAAHAGNDDQSPWQSAIRFLPDEHGGYLRASDVLDLQLDAGLAVLSSCSSGTGKIINGEGVLGLSTAFLSAGVPAVLASLWAVDDGATAGFMQLYYGYLADGQDCAGALTSAQREMRGRPATSHPYYWAGFALIGEGSLEPQLERSRGWLGPVSAMLLGVGFLGSVALQRRRPGLPANGSDLSGSDSS